MTDKVYLVLQDDGVENPTPIRVFSSKCLAEDYLDSRFIPCRNSIWQDKEIFHRTYFIDEWCVD